MGKNFIWIEFIKKLYVSRVVVNHSIKKEVGILYKEILWVIHFLSDKPNENKNG